MWSRKRTMKPCRVPSVVPLGWSRVNRDRIRILTVETLKRNPCHLLVHETLIPRTSPGLAAALPRNIPQTVLRHRSLTPYRRLMALLRIGSGVERRRTCTTSTRGIPRTRNGRLRWTRRIGTIPGSTTPPPRRCLPTRTTNNNSNT